MSYSIEGHYSSQRQEAKVAALLRSIMQDATRDFKKETIDVIFKKKEVNGVDIGKVCSRWVKHIACSLENNEALQTKLNFLVFCKYHQGIDLDKDLQWHLFWLKIGVPLFSNKINRFPSTGRAAPMASLEKPQSEEFEDFDDAPW